MKPADSRPVMSNPTNERSAALLMAVYTFLLALGAVMPLAASYSEGVASRTSESHMRSGAYQRRVQVHADASDSVGVELPERAVSLDSVEALTSPNLELGSDCPAHLPMGDSRGS